jgi:hypothetical protein
MKEKKQGSGRYLAGWKRFGSQNRLRSGLKNGERSEGRKRAEGKK